MSKEKKTIEELVEEAIVPEAEQPYEVPENWRWVKLKILNKNKKRNIEPKNFSDEVFELYSVPSYSDDTPEYITGVEIGSSKQLVNSNEVLLCKINPRINRVWKVSNNNREYRQLASTEWIVISENKGINPNYLLYLLRSPYFRKLISSNVSGVGGSLTRARPKEVEGYPIAIPPLNEQNRIATKLERLLNKIEEAKQLIEEANETFELRRAAILDKAFHGELTRKWRNENSSLLQKSIDSSYLDGIKVKNDFYNDFYLPSTWGWAKAESLFQIQPRNGYSPKSTEDITNTKTIKLGAITKGYFKENEYKYIDETIDKESYLWLKHGDFLIQRANSLDYVGTAAIYTGSDDEFIYPDLIMKGRVNEELVLPEYMVLWINSHYGKKYIKQNATGTAGNMPKINQKVVKNILIPIPPIQEQIEIIRVVNQTNRKDIEVNISDASESLEIIKQSIFSKAFRGELGTNDPSDESAIELLKEVLQEQVK